MSGSQAYDEPLSVEVCDGEVVLRTSAGPFGVSLTPTAAAMTADALAAAASVAQDQASQDTGRED